jgi:DNA-directed RNA polymerase subunit alpha
MLIAQRPTLTEEVVSDNRSRFVIEPLEPGFGYTLGNSMRRTLLSSIPGTAGRDQRPGRSGVRILLR